MEVVWGRAEEQPIDAYGVALAKALAQPPGGGRALPSARRARAALAILWVGETADATRVARAAARLAAELEPRPRRVSSCSASWVRLHPAFPGGRGWRRSDRWCRRTPEQRPREASGPATSLSWCPPGSTRSRTRRAASARRRPPSTSARASPRRASACCSIDLDPQANATSGSRNARERRVDARPARRRAARRAREAVRRSRTSTSSWRRATSPPQPSSSRAARAASATSRTRSTGALEPYSYVFLDCPPSFGPLTVNALAAADRAIVPVQAEYYALEGLSQLLGTINLVKARLNPELAVAGILLTMADGRTRLAAEVEAELRRHFGALVFTTTDPPLGPPRRGAEPRASLRSPTTGAPPAREAYWKVAMELVERS